MSCRNNTLIRGVDNEQNDQYSATVADYSTTVTGDNVVFNLTCDSGVAIGDWVRLNGGTVVKAQANTATNSRVIGIVVSKTGATICDVQTVGSTSSLFSGLIVNADYFLSPTTAGTMTNIAPTGSGNIVLLLGRTLNGTQFTIDVAQPIVRA